MHYICTAYKSNNLPKDLSSFVSFLKQKKSTIFPRLHSEYVPFCRHHQKPNGMERRTQSSEKRIEEGRRYPHFLSVCAPFSRKIMPVTWIRRQKSKVALVFPVVCFRPRLESYHQAKRLRHTKLLCPKSAPLHSLTLYLWDILRHTLLFLSVYFTTG